MADAKSASPQLKSSWQENPSQSTTQNSETQISSSDLSFAYTSSNPSHHSLCQGLAMFPDHKQLTAPNMGHDGHKCAGFRHFDDNWRRYSHLYRRIHNLQWMYNSCRLRAHRYRRAHRPRHQHSHLDDWVWRCRAVCDKSSPWSRGWWGPVAGCIHVRSEHGSWSDIIRYRWWRERRKASNSDT